MDSHHQHPSARTLHDFQLVAQAVAGSERAYLVLFNRHRPYLYYRLLHMVHNDQDAEDLLLETFAKAFKHLPRFKPVYAFGTWLCRIAINHALDFVRRKKGQALSLQAYPEEHTFDLISEHPGPEESFVRHERLGQLLDCINGLSPNCQAIARLRYFGELSYREIAERLTTPIGTVKTRLNRSRKLLTKQLGYRE